MKKIKWIQSHYLKNEKGELMIESMLVMIPVLFVLVFIICLGFFFFQRWNIQITANETANRIAQMYPVLEGKLGEGVSNYQQIEDIAKYRYLFSNEKYITDNQERGETFGKHYLSLVSLAYPDEEPEFLVEVVEDAFACRHVKVTVVGTYTLPFAEGFELFHLKGKYTYSAVGEAMCTDLSDYLVSVNYVTNLEKILNVNHFSGVSMVNSILNMIKKIAAAVDSF